MKALAFHLSTVLVASLVMAIPALGQGPAASPGAEHEPEEIQALKKKLAEQDRRISQLEEQVRMLLAAEKPSSAATTSLAAKATSPSGPAQSSASEPASNAVISKSAEAKKEPEIPALTVAQTQPEKPKASSVLAPIHFGGDVYLYQYVPAGVSGAAPKFELYAFSALVDGQKGPWGFHADYRLRTTKLRSFFPGNTWLQQGYVRYDTPWGEIRAGSFYRRVGIEWDDSFFGNIQYFDGLKLDPQFGVGFSGSHNLSGRLGAEYSLQYFSTDSRVNGSLPGHDFVSEIGARALPATFQFQPGKLSRC